MEVTKIYQHIQHQILRYMVRVTHLKTSVQNVPTN
jgi:hypothetical protein